MTGTFNCPLCGKDVPHEHSPAEQVIYRNGCKISQDQLLQAKMDVLREAADHFESNTGTQAQFALRRMADEIEKEGK